MASESRTLFVIGSGPGIGRSVAALFASKRYNKVALFERRAEQLEIEKAVLEETAGSRKIQVETFAVDVVHTKAFKTAFAEAEAKLGKPECIFYNAARVLPSELLTHGVEDIEYDFGINVTALYGVAQAQIQQLIEMANTDPSSMPSLIVTSSMLPFEPIPQVFALSLVKAAQRSLVQSLAMTYASQGVHIGLINVGGPVSPEHETWNPTNIAARAWDWFEQSKVNRTFEVKI